MISIDEAETMLDEIAEELPKEFFRYLNGGILLLPDTKLHPESKEDGLYILGEYHNERSLGRYIVLYYGSFVRIFGYLPREALRDKFKEVLIHEFTHHLESLAGERELEIKDAIFMEKYRQRD